MIFKKNKDMLNILIICFFILLLTLPFINKAFHVDDTAYIYVARQIIKAPLYPYSFNFEWSSNTGLATSISNPPLVSYYFAVILLMFKESELILHLFFIIFPLTAGISMYYISKKFTRKALFPTLFLVTSVAFAVNSHNLMLDIPFLAFFLLSIALYLYGTDLNNNLLLILGAVFAGLAYLTKYSGIIIIPILAIYALSKKKFKPLLYLIIPALIIGFWNLYTFIIYGSAHNSEIFNWLLSSQSSFTPQSIIIRIVTNLTYIGGATIFPLMLIYPFLINNKNKLAYLFIAIIASALSVMLYFASAAFAFRYTIPQLALFAFFLSTGLFFFFAVFRYYFAVFRKMAKSKNMLGNENHANNIFLFSWLLIGLIFISTLAGGAVRFIIIIMPPMMITYFKMTEYHKFLNPSRLKNFVFLTLALTIALSTFVAYADYEFANIYRDFPESISSFKSNDNKIWFTGHLGFQYYMERKGYIALGLMDNSPKKGDIIIKARIPSPRKFSPKLSERLELLSTKSYGGRLPLKVQNPEARAGFYTYGSGFLPYSFSYSSLEDFEIYEVVK